MDWSNVFAGGGDNGLGGAVDYTSGAGLDSVTGGGGGGAGALLSNLGGSSGLWTNVIGNIGGALIGSRAAGRAGDAQAQASRDSIAEQRRQYDLSRADQAPFMETGTLANARLRTLLGLDAGEGSGSLTRKMTQADIDADPVYQSGLKFGLDEGTKAINNRAIAGGGYDSGATLKALTRYGNDYGSTKANESYNRYTADNTGIYNKLAGVSGAGQNATNQVQAAGTNAANSVSGSLNDAGNSRAATIIGQGNAWQDAIGGITNSVNADAENRRLRALLRQYGY